jgi:serine/threonine-protein kinase
MSQYCSQGHENPSGSRFCLQCGEKLAMVEQNGIEPGQLLGDRYRIVRQLGQGGFGRAYLAEDINRFREYCVLKEFAPQVQSAYVLEKAEELFEREAGVLYKLQHPQIPRFRELFRVDLAGKGYLFLVQDYVEGQTYYALLNARKQQGMCFNEIEVTQLLLQILPVLEYIHSLGVIHRDISPDNIILRSSDYLPVLIDFGAVKQVAAIASQLSQSGGSFSAVTLMGKVGYAPHEQMQMGVVYPHSDLYALAATVLVLLTGTEPQELIDEYTLSWNWRNRVNLSPTLEAVLAKMLSQGTGDRFQSARQVLQALTSSNTASYAPSQTPPPETQATLAVAPPPHTLPTPQTAPLVTSSSSPSTSPLGKILLVFLLLIGAGIMGWWATNRWLQSSIPPQEEITPQPTLPTPIEPSVFSAEEQNRKERLRDRIRQQGINYKFYTALVNQAFWDKYPNQRGRNLSSSPEDATLRAEWDKTADELLDKLESLNLEARRSLGTYTAQERLRWKVQVNKRYVSSRALYDLADAAFFELFPQQRGKNFIKQPIGQFWYALAAEKLKDIVAGTAFERIVFEPGAIGKQVSGTLNPGEGKVYIAGLAKEQLMNLNLQANPQVLLSVYSPSGNKILLEDSSSRALSTTLPEKGFYEFVVVSTASEPID